MSQLQKLAYTFFDNLDCIELSIHKNYVDKSKVAKGDNKYQKRPPAIPSETNSFVINFVTQI